MRYLLIILLILPVITNAQVIKEEDEFTGKVTWKSESTRPITVEKGDIMRALYLASYSDEYWVIAIYAVSTKGESIYSNDTVYFLADGERISLDVVSRDLDYQSSAMVSYVAVTATKDQFHTIGFADEVRIKVGTNIFAIGKEERVDMRRIVRMVSEELGE